MLWPKASPLDLDFGLCARAKLFNKANSVQLQLQLPTVSKVNKTVDLFVKLIVLTV